MKKWVRILAVLISFSLLLVLSGCQKKAIGPELYSDWRPGDFHSPGEPKAVDHVGTIPTMLAPLIEKNVFSKGTAYGDRVLRADILSVDEENHTHVQQVTMVDLYGRELGRYTCTSPDSYRVQTLTATADGGFLFVLGFSDRAYDQDTWASDDGFASRVIKCDRAGNVQFDRPFPDTEGSAMNFCYEKGGRFYFFGTIQSPETKTKGVYSRTDIICTAMDENGIVVESKVIAGSDFDSLYMAEPCEGGFLLSISAQSEDGDFADSDSKGHPVDWVFTVSDALEITGKEKKAGRSVFDTRIGEIQGYPMFSSHSLLKGFDGGTVYVYLDYGDFYLIVSENRTGIYENTPLMISSIWYYTETVYSAYDHNGNLLFRTSVDSTPNYGTY